MGNVGYCFICTSQPPELPVSEAAAVNAHKNANKFINLQGPSGQCMSAITMPSQLQHDVCTVKGKAVPLQAWSGPDGSRKLRFPDFVTTAQDGGKVVSLTHRPPLPPGSAPGTHFC